MIKIENTKIYYIILNKVKNNWLNKQSKQNCEYSTAIK